MRLLRWPAQETLSAYMKECAQQLKAIVKKAGSELRRTLPEFLLRGPGLVDAE